MQSVAGIVALSFIFLALVVAFVLSHALHWTFLTLGIIDNPILGDRFTVTTGQGIATYSVLDRRTAGDPSPSLAVGHGLLTLTTARGAAFAPLGVLRVDAALVSRLHCRLAAGAGEIEAVDLESTNGTYVNGQRVDRAVLKEGDKLRVGAVELVVLKSVAFSS